MKNNRETIASAAHKSCAALTLQCLADSGTAAWQTAYERQIANAKKLGLMPEDFKVIRETLADFGFSMQGTAVEGIRASEVLSGLGSFEAPAVACLQISDHRYLGGYMVAVRMEGGRYTPVTALPSADYLDKHKVTHVWIRWNDGVDRSPCPRRRARHGAGDAPKKRNIPETAYYKPFQPNPCGNYIGDCVVRAAAGAMDISWNEAMDVLAAAREVAVNARSVYPRVLAKHGFVRHTPLLRDGRHLSGKAFCEEMNARYRHGERIFARIGRLHVAAIVPVTVDGGGKTYKIIDSWDSSARLVRDYWVSPAGASGAEDAAASSHGGETPKAACVGCRLNHPLLGEGIVTKAVPGILTVDFGKRGALRLDEAWVCAHCVLIGPGTEQKRTESGRR